MGQQEATVREKCRTWPISSMIYTPQQSERIKLLTAGSHGLKRLLSRVAAASLSPQETEGSRN